MSRDTESLTTIPAPGPPAVLAAVMGTRAFPALSQGQDGGSVPRLSPGQAGGKRTGSSGKAPGSATRQRRRTFWTAPSDAEWGAGVEAGKGRGPPRARARDAGVENFPSLQWSPRPRPARYVTAPPQPGGAGPGAGGQRCGAFPRSPGAHRGGGGAPASAGAAIEMSLELSSGASGLEPAHTPRTCQCVCGRGGAPLGVLVAARGG